LLATPRLRPRQQHLHQPQRPRSLRRARSSRRALSRAEAARRNTKEFKEQQEREAAEARKKAEEERHRAEEEAKARAEREANKRTEAAAKAAAAPAKAPITPARPAAVAADGSDDDEAPRMVRRPGGGPARPVVAAKPAAKPGPAKQRGRLTISTALNADDVRERSIASFRRRTQRITGHRERAEGKGHRAK
jgi:translation initiation factor IF-2